MLCNNRRYKIPFPGPVLPPGGSVFVYATVSYTCCPLLNQCEYTPLSHRLSLAILCKYDVIHKPEVNNVSQRRQKSTE